jgi:hypothetical protein
MLCEHVRSMTMPQVCSANYGQNLWKTEHGRSCKRLMTLGMGLEVVHANHNETGWVDIQKMHDDRNDRLRWL